MNITELVHPVLEKQINITLKKKALKVKSHFLNFYCPSVIHSVHSTSHLAKNTLVCTGMGVLLHM